MNDLAYFLGFASGSALGLCFFIPLVLAALARFGGWREVAERFPLGERPWPAQRRLMGWGLFNGWCGYNGCLIVAADSSGLYLHIWPVLRLFHAPLFIPWREISRIEARRRIFHTYYRLSPLPIDIHSNTIAALRDQARAASVPGEY